MVGLRDDIQDMPYLTLNLVDSRVIANTSTFSFTNIGEGRYFLALKYSGQPEIIMEQSTVIELSRKQMKMDVGEITVTAKP